MHRIQLFAGIFVIPRGIKVSEWLKQIGVKNEAKSMARAPS